jgi:hypothetical protein
VNKFVVAALAISASFNALAFGESDAAKLVKAYSKTVACSIEESKYQAIQMSGTPGDSFEGDKYLVLWSGDVGCAGGNATVFPQITIVEIRGHSTPMVMADAKTPSIELVQVTKFNFKDNKLTLEGIINTGDPKRPTKKSVQSFKVTEMGEFVPAK